MDGTRDQDVIMEEKKTKSDREETTSAGRVVDLILMEGDTIATDSRLDAESPNKEEQEQQTKICSDRRGRSPTRQFAGKGRGLVEVKAAGLGGGPKPCNIDTWKVGRTEYGRIHEKLAKAVRKVLKSSSVSPMRSKLDTAVKSNSLSPTLALRTGREWSGSTLSQGGTGRPEERTGLDVIPKPTSQGSR
ncbi:hypothetical protein V7S43_010501 [Phytophthora oleae]|uniref:Uncharacterized protein n=1 Tax=Phytophthora oleae TaxID=2107226 RepID=A0ABD3FEL6_9STRA